MGYASDVYLYWLNGPFTLCVSIIGALLNLLTIYIVSLYALPHQGRHHHHYSGLNPRSNMASSLLSVWSALKRQKVSAVHLPATAQPMQKPIPTCVVQQYEEEAATSRGCSRAAPVKAKTLTLSMDLSSGGGGLDWGLSPPLCTPVSPAAPTAEQQVQVSSKRSLDSRPIWVSSLTSLSSSPPSATACYHPPSRGKSSGGGVQKSRVYNFLLWMTMTDTLLLLCAQFMYAWPTLFPTSGPVLNASLVAYWLGNASMMASAWLMLALTFDRYWTLKRRPFERSGLRHANGKRDLIHKMAASLCVLTLTCALPRLLEYRVKCSQGVEEAQCQVVASPLLQEWWYFGSYRLLGGALLYAVVPHAFIFLFLCKVWSVINVANRLKYTRIILKPAADRISKISGQYRPIHKFVRHRLHSIEYTDSELILMFLNLKFLLSRLGPWLCDCVTFYVWTVSGEYESELEREGMLISASNLLVVVSSAINFFIFYVFSSTFRRYLLAE